VFLHREPTDMRKSFEGLAYLAREVVEQDPLSGYLFMFVNKSRSSTKILYWDKSGYAIWYKQLQAGRFSGSLKSELTYTEMLCLLDGLEFDKMPRKVRFSREFG
jgi:transposase